MEYTLLYDTIASRISIDEVEAKDGKLRLMKTYGGNMISSPYVDCWWYRWGKTYFILTLIEALLPTDSKTGYSLTRKC